MGRGFLRKLKTLKQEMQTTNVDNSALFAAITNDKGRWVILREERYSSRPNKRLQELLAKNGETNVLTTFAKKWPSKTGVLMSSNSIKFSISLQNSTLAAIS